MVMMKIMTVVAMMVKIMVLLVVMVMEELLTVVMAIRNDGGPILWPPDPFTFLLQTALPSLQTHKDLPLHLPAPVTHRNRREQQGCVRVRSSLRSMGSILLGLGETTLCRAWPEGVEGLCSCTLTLPSHSLLTRSRQSSTLFPREHSEPSATGTNFPPKIRPP